MKRRANDSSKKCHFEYSDLIFERKIRNCFRNIYRKKIDSKKSKILTPKGVKKSTFDQNVKLGVQSDHSPEFETKRWKNKKLT